MVKEVQQTNTQHAVPQNIMDVEFKLIGQLTMRQFSYLFVFGMLGYIIQQLLFGLFKWPLAFVSWTVGIGFAFVPIEERGLDEWAVNFIKAVYKPTQRVWRKTPEVPSVLNYRNVDIVRQELITLAPTASRRRLEEYLDYKKDEVEDPLDIPEQEYLMKIQQAYANYSPIQAAPEVRQEPQIPDQKFSKKENEEISSEKPTKKDIKSTQDPGKSEETKKSISEKEKIIKGSSEIIKARAVPNTGSYKPKKSILKPMTPDMHSGRKFTNLLPSRGELVLPIRGEKVLEISEQVDTEDVKAKAAKLQKLLTEIKRSEGIYEHKKVETKVVSPEPIAEETEKEVQDLISKLRSEIKKITDKLAQVQKDNNLDNKENLIQQLEKHKEEIEEKYRLLNDQMSSLKNDSPSKDQKRPPVSSQSVPVSEAFAKHNSVNKPNIVGGVVMDASGKPIPGVLLIIKDEKEEPTRAFKTNSLGQFFITTPLRNGHYTLEVSQNNDTNLSFDIISIEAKGEIIPPFEIKGK